MKNSGNKTGLFLVELIIALLLFAFCAAICVQVFVSARQKAQDSEALSHSVFLATSAAECYKSTNGDMTKVAALLGVNSDGGAVLGIRYDADWGILTAIGDERYYLDVKKNPDGTASIEISTDAKAAPAKVIFSIAVGMVS